MIIGFAKCREYRLVLGKGNPLLVSILIVGVGGVIILERLRLLLILLEIILGERLRICRGIIVKRTGIILHELLLVVGLLLRSELLMNKLLLLYWVPRLDGSSQ